MTRTLIMIRCTHRVSYRKNFQGFQLDYPSLHEAQRAAGLLATHEGITGVQLEELARPLERCGYIAVTDRGEESPVLTYERACAWLDARQPERMRAQHGFYSEPALANPVNVVRHTCRYRNYCDMPALWQALGWSNAPEVCFACVEQPGGCPRHDPAPL